MLTIYAIPESYYCAKVRIVLRRKGLEWREVPPPGGYGSDEYKTVVPSGNLPAMRDGDLMIGDSEAIAEYLEEAYPEPPMLPKGLGDRAKTRERGRFHDTRLEPAVRALFPFIHREPRIPDHLDMLSDAITARMNQLGHMLEDQPGAGGELTLGDCGYPICCLWIEAMTPVMGLRVSWPQNVSDYRRRIEAHAEVQAEIESYGPRVRAYLSGAT